MAGKKPKKRLAPPRLAQVPMSGITANPDWIFSNHARSVLESWITKVLMAERALRAHCRWLEQEEIPTHDTPLTDEQLDEVLDNGFGATPEPARPQVVQLFNNTAQLRQIHDALLERTPAHWRRHVAECEQLLSDEEKSAWARA